MLFSAFPKTRKPLPDAYQNIYAKHYLKNRSGETKATFLSQKLESWMHKKVAKDRINSSDEPSTLEIGAGTLNHLEYESTTIYDIVEPFEELYKNSKYLSEVRSIYSDIGEIENSKKYDRIISVATFEHITNLPEVFAKSCQLLSKEGTLRFAIPNEGTWLWKLGYQLTTGIEFRLLYGLKYEVLMKYEHINTADEIDEMARFFFKDIKMSVLGVNKQTAFYRFYECNNPNLENLETFLDEN